MEDNNHQHPNPNPNVVQPQPVPTTFNIAQVMTNDGKILAQLTMSSPTGIHVVFLDSVVAKAVGEALTTIGAMSASGLLTP